MIDGKLGYILLVGDVYICSSDSCPPEDRSVIIPSHYSSFGYNGVVDIYYAALDSSEDMSPDIFIGRISASDSLEVKSFIEKVLGYEPHIRDDDNPWYKKVLFVGGEDTGFDGDKLELGESYSNCEEYIPTDYQFDNVYYDGNFETDCSDSVEALIEEGYLLTLYYGHGMDYYWSEAFYPRDYEDLDNENRYPLIFAYSCETAHIDGPSSLPGVCHPDDTYRPLSSNCYSPAAPVEVDAYDCMAERITNIADRGAIGYIGFSRSEPIPFKTGLDPNAAFLSSFFNSDYAYLGEIVIDYYYKIEFGMYEYVVIGDPALNLFSVENEDTSENCVDLMLKNDNLHFSSILNIGILDTLLCDVVNYGPDDADSVVIEAWYDTTLLSSTVIDTVRASHYSTAKLPISFSSIGNYNITIIVNPDSLITEYRYSNNQVDTITTALDIKSGFPFTLDVPDTIASRKDYLSCPVVDRFRSASYNDILVNDNGGNIKLINTSGVSLDAVSNCSMEYDAILPVGYISNSSSKELCTVKVRPSYASDKLIFSVYKWESLNWQLVDTLSVVEDIPTLARSSIELTCIHDVTNDGQLEIVYCEGYVEDMIRYFGKLFILTYNNGIALCDSLSLDYKPLSIAVEDIDHDYYPEIVIMGVGLTPSISMEITILEYDNGLLIEHENSFECDNISFSQGRFVTGEVILSDVNNDKYLDIVSVLDNVLVIYNGSSENYSTLYSGLIDNDYSENTSLCAGNLDLDERNEIIILRDDWIRTYEYDEILSVVDSFEFTEGCMVSGPYIADVNNDDSNEIVFSAASAADEITEKYSIYILNSSLDNITGWDSLNVYNTMNGWSANQKVYPQIVLADIEPDGKVDLLMQTRDELYAIELPWSQGGELSWPRPGCNSRMNNCEKRFVRTLSDHDTALHGIIEAWGDFGSDTTSTISIGPGTIISIDTLDMDSSGNDEDKIEFVVTGNILARGNAIDPIILSSLIENEVGEWVGIIDDSTGLKSEYDYVTIDYSETAIESSSPIELSHCTIAESNSQAFDLSSNASIDSSTIYLNSDHVIESGDTFSITGNTEFIIGTEDLSKHWNDTTKVEFWVFGRLDIYGNTSDKVEFKSRSASPDAGEWYGIVLADSSATASIRNCKISDAKYGLRTPTTVTLRNVDVSNCDPVGIYLYENEYTSLYGNRSTLDKCNISHNDDTDAVGIRIWYCTDVVVDSCDVNHNYRGIWVSDCSPDISYTDACYNDENGILITDWYFVAGRPYVEIERCKILENGEEGLYVSDSRGLFSYTKIDDNVSYGIYITGSGSKPEIERCKVTNHSTGIRINSAWPVLGDTLIFGPHIRGYNTFDNTVFNVYQNSGGRTIKALNNYWGYSPPYPSKIRGPVTYHPYLDSDPVAYLARSQNEGTITSVHLYQNFPNPLRSGSTTNIKFSLPKAQKISIKVYDVSGRRIKTLVSGMMQPGHHYVTWNGRNERGTQVAPGIYFYQMKYGDKVLSNKKIVFIR